MVTLTVFALSLWIWNIMRIRALWLNLTVGRRNSFAFIRRDYEFWQSRACQLWFYFSRIKIYFWLQSQLKWNQISKRSKCGTGLLILSHVIRKEFQGCFNQIFDRSQIKLWQNWGPAVLTLRISTDTSNTSITGPL